MITENCNAVSFNAKFIKPVLVKKMNSETNRYHNVSVSVVEVLPQDLCDVYSISITAKSWENDLFAGNIAYNLSQLFQSKTKDTDLRFFALTKQKENFDDLESDDILGLCEINQSRPNELQLNYIQTNPQFIYSLGLAAYKGIGTALIKFLHSMENIDIITLIARKTYAVSNFYKKNGFINTENNKFVYIKNRGKYV